MTLDEAIKHCEEVAEEYQATIDRLDIVGKGLDECEECAKEHRQLAEWLRELKEYRDKETVKITEIYTQGYYDGYDDGYDKGHGEIKADAISFNEPTHEGYAERCNHTQNEGAYDE